MVLCDTVHAKCDISSSGELSVAIVRSLFFLMVKVDLVTSVGSTGTFFGHEFRLGISFDGSFFLVG